MLQMVAEKEEFCAVAVGHACTEKVKNQSQLIGCPVSGSYRPLISYLLFIL